VKFFCLYLLNYIILHLVQNCIYVQEYLRFVFISPKYLLLYILLSELLLSHSNYEILRPLVRKVHLQVLSAVIVLAPLAVSRYLQFLYQVPRKLLSQLAP